MTMIEMPTHCGCHDYGHADDYPLGVFLVSDHESDLDLLYFFFGYRLVDYHPLDWRSCYDFASCHHDHGGGGARDPFCLLAFPIAQMAW